MTAMDTNFDIAIFRAPAQTQSAKACAVDSIWSPVECVGPADLPQKSGVLAIGMP
jgi:hypothetical protein